MLECYTLMRFLDPEGLKSRGIEHFDAWTAVNGVFPQKLWSGINELVGSAAPDFWASCALYTAHGHYPLDTLNVVRAGHLLYL